MNINKVVRRHFQSDNLIRVYTKSLRDLDIETIAEMEEREWKRDNRDSNRNHYCIKPPEFPTYSSYTLCWVCSDVILGYGIGERTRSGLSPRIGEGRPTCIPGVRVCDECDAKIKRKPHSRKCYSPLEAKLRRDSVFPILSGNVESDAVEIVFGVPIKVSLRPVVN